MEWNIYKWVLSQENVKMPRIQNHLSHIWYDVLLFTFVIWNLFFNLILYQTLSPKLISHFVNMHVGMGWKIFVETQITINPLNKIVSKQLYTQLKVAKIIFYHWPHTQINDEPAHGKHDLDSIMWPSFFAPRISEVLKDHVWTQLGLGYIIKQIYDKHKVIWWGRINVRVMMTRADFIRQ
jgi:hypothetical protein